MENIKITHINQEYVWYILTDLGTDDFPRKCEHLIFKELLSENKLILDRDFFY